MGANDVRAGGAFVEVYTTDRVDEGLSRANQKVRQALTLTKGLISSAGSTAVAGAGTAYAAVTLIGRGVANAVTATARRVASAVAAPQRALDGTALALQRITPTSQKVWDFMEGGVLRGSRALGGLRSLLESAGPAASPLLAAFDGIGNKLEAVAAKAKRASLLFGDRAGAATFRNLQERGQQASIATAYANGGRTGIIGDALRLARSPLRAIEAAQGAVLNPLATARGAIGRFQDVGFGGYGATARVFTQRGAAAAGRGVLSIGNTATLGILNKMISGTQALARSMAGIPAARTAAGMDAVAKGTDQATSRISRLIGTLTRLKTVGTSAFDALKSGSSKLGGLSAGILGPLGLAAALNVGGIHDLFTSKGFAQHGADLHDEASKNGISVEKQSTLNAASKLSGVSMDEAKKDPLKRAQLLGAVNRAVSLGAVVTTQQAIAAKEATADLSAMSIAARSIGTAIGSAVLPQVMQSVRWTTQLAVAVAGWIQKNPALIQQVFQVGKACGIAAAVLGGLSAAVAFISSPIGAATVAVAALTALFPALRTETQGVLGWINTGLQTLRNDFDATFGGMTDALAAGDLSLAAEVLWSGIQLVFNRGWEFLNSGWMTAKNATVGIVDGLLTDLRIKLDEWFPGFEQGFSDTLGFVNDAWTIGVNTLLNVWDGAFAILKKSLNYLRSLFDKTFNLEAANESIDQQFKHSIENRSTGQADLLAQRDQERKKRAAALATNGTAATLRAEQEERAKAREQEAAAQRANDLDAVRRAQANLAAVRNQAKEERAAKEKELKATIAAGADLAKKGALEASRKGADAHDIRTQGGLSAIAQAARGDGSLLQHQKTTADEAKKANQWNQKHWQQLVQINNNLPVFDVKPI
ncbi:MAG: hypothetical protein U0941_30045 [Planctomycetaceae bacterium]